MNVKLVVAGGRGPRQTFSLPGEQTVIGRRHGCDLRIPSAEISRRHCVLRTADGYLTVEDLNSANGTYLNGRPVTGRSVVRPGDRLQVGPVTFLVEYPLSRAAGDLLAQGAAPAESVAEALAVEDAEEVTDAVEAVEEAIPVSDGDVPIQFDDEPHRAEEVFDGAIPWAKPEDDDLRKILSQMDGSKE